MCDVKVCSAVAARPPGTGTEAAMGDGMGWMNAGTHEPGAGGGFPRVGEWRAAAERSVQDVLATKGRAGGYRGHLHPVRMHVCTGFCLYILSYCTSQEGVSYIKTPKKTGQKSTAKCIMVLRS
jgi:hypothetical protein